MTMEKSIDKMNTGDFESLVQHIQTVGNVLQQDARLIINRNVTTRAWLTGLYIVEYEQQGNDRAKYGTNLLQELSKRLGGKSYGVSNLKNFRQFYLYYPDLRTIIGAYLQSEFQIRHSLNGELWLDEIRHSLNGEFAPLQIAQSMTAKSESILSVQEVSRDGFAMSMSDGSVKAVPQMLFNRLSFTHIVQLLHVEDDLQRAFYAIEAMRGPWSVRELQRQIDSNYYTRSGWSKNPELLSKRVNSKEDKPSFAEEIKSPYIFEFLGLRAKDTIGEIDLEDTP